MHDSFRVRIPLVPPFQSWQASYNSLLSIVPTPGGDRCKLCLQELWRRNKESGYLPNCCKRDLQGLCCNVRDWFHSEQHLEEVVQVFGPPTVAAFFKHISVPSVLYSGEMCRMHPNGCKHPVWLRTKAMGNCRTKQFCRRELKSI